MSDIDQGHNEVAIVNSIDHADRTDTNSPTFAALQLSAASRTRIFSERNELLQYCFMGL
jgi:hypothetical protein